MAKAKTNWIASALKNAVPGALHKATGTPAGKKIPASKVSKAAKSGSPKVRKEAVLAKTLSSFKK